MKKQNRDLTVLLFQLCHHVSADGDGDGDGELGSVRGASACLCPVAAGESTPLSVGLTGGRGHSGAGRRRQEVLILQQQKVFQTRFIT